MDELFFTGMDILEQTRKLVEKATDSVCKGLTDSEREAYLGGVANTLSALQCMLEVDCDGEPIVHISGIEGLEEMSIEELEDRFLNN
ncbi:MAG: hypothetical protein UHD64_10040 [Bacteroidales bacterium]|nr:hypothetical protein [Bacteroidales bacterium]